MTIKEHLERLYLICKKLAAQQVKIVEEAQETDESILTVLRLIRESKDELNTRMDMANIAEYPVPKEHLKTPGTVTRVYKDSGECGLEMPDYE